MATDADAARRPGSIRRRGNSLQVRLFAGRDPVTGRDRYLAATIKGTDKAARKKAEDKLAEFRTHVLNQRTADSSVPLSHAINEWLRTSEIEDSTRAGYVNYIERYIRPIIGEVPARKIDAHALESFYTELRRCRTRCDRRPFIEKHTTEDPHDCATAKCIPHACKPLAASTVRQIHSVISGTMTAAERWGWINSNPARAARRPRPKPPEPDPPTPAEAAKLAEEAFRMDDDWGTLVWLVMTTGIRRGELCGLASPA